MQEGARAETERALKPHSHGGGSGLGQPGSADLSEERKGSGVGAMESGERPVGIWRLDAGLGCPWRPIVRPAALVGCAPGLRVRSAAGWAFPPVSTWGACLVGGWVLIRLVSCGREAQCQQDSDSLIWVLGVECHIWE